MPSTKKKGLTWSYGTLLLLGAVVLLVYISVLLLKPFLLTLFAAALLAYLCFPLYRFFSSKLKNRSVAAFCLIVLMLLLVIIPLAIVVNSLRQEIALNYLYARDFLRKDCTNPQNYFCDFVDNVASVTSFTGLDRLTFSEGVRTFVESTILRFSGALWSIPTLLLHLFILVVLLYYFFIEGEALIERSKQVLRLKKAHARKIVHKIADMIYSVFYGMLVIGIAQGILAAILFKILGVSSPFLLGFLIMVLAFIPMLGSSLVWLPLGVYHLAIGHVVTGIGILFFGAVVISGLELFLKPKIIGDRANVHPAIVLLGALGGLSVFGIVGFLLGPILLALLMTTIDIYLAEREHHEA
ncbi:AI-2E family transporter [Candidatus Woesearchaeota archaeon]|nr:AI-2E family transporter [Candidatus Woesearchaeota archaeon]